MSKMLLIAALLCALPAARPADAAHGSHIPRKMHTGARKPALPAVSIGGDGVFGTAYTVSDGGEYGPISITLLRAEYSAGHFNIAGRETVVPKPDEKLLILHYRVKNPNPSNFFFASRPLFQTIDADEQMREDIGESRREDQKEKVSAMLKPGQSLDDLVTCAVIPAQGPLPKLILTLGRVGLDEEGVTYPLGTGKNSVRPLPVPYADPADAATARAEVPARWGIAYMAGGYDIALISARFAPGPFGFLSADEGQRFLVATVIVTNRNWDTSYFDDTLAATLATSDSVKTSGYTPLQALRNAYFDGKELAPGESLTLRLAFPVAQEAAAGTLKIAERTDELGGRSTRTAAVGAGFHKRHRSSIKILFLERLPAVRIALPIAQFAAEDDALAFGFRPAPPQQNRKPSAGNKRRRESQFHRSAA